jgi:hypothetical protein
MATATATQEKKEKPAEKKVDVKPSALEFLKEKIGKNAEFTRIDIRPISEHFFRINFYCEIPVADCIVKKYDMSRSDFVEVIETADGFGIVNHTNNKILGSV